MKRILLAIIAVCMVIPKAALAHCPLCTAGAGALAVLAASLGVSSVIVGILIGAFALALGLWLGRIVKKKYVPYQQYILAAIIFLGTVLPIIPLVLDFGPLYLSLGGEYGSLLHNTYTINLYIAGVILGAAIVLISAPLSRLLTKVRGQQLPYQGLSITLGLLIVCSVIVQLLS